MPKLHAQLLGGLEFRDDSGGELKLATRKARALLAFLIADSDNWHTRERLAGLLWSDRQQAQARHSLTQALGTIRKLGNRIDQALIETEGDRVRLMTDAIEADVIAFRSSADNDPVSAAVSYRGALLGNFVAGDSIFDEWLTTERTTLQQQASRILEIASVQMLQSGDDRAAQDIALQLVAMEPLSETAHRNLMRLLARSGDRSGAIQQFQVCERVLRDELGIAPSDETLRLFDEIKTDRLAADEVQTADQPLPTPTGKVERQSPTSISITSTASDDESRPSIAVMPFTNLSTDPDQEFFVDGLADDIINTLSKISKMRVIARHSTFTYKDRTIDVRQIADELGVRYVLEGSVRRAGNKLRVTAQLVDSKDGSPVWAERFDRQVEDLFDIQDEITKEVVTALQINLTDGEDARAWSRGTNNIEAWQFCVQAKELQDRLSATHLFESRPLAEKAIALDPNYAYAWVVLGFSYFREARLDFSGDRHERLLKAEELANKAFRLDDTVAWAVALKALTAAALGRHSEGEEIARRAINMQPGNAGMRAFASIVFAFAGKFHELIEQGEIALSLDPFPPLWYRTGIFRSHALLGDHHTALELIGRVLKVEPDNIPARIFQSYCLQSLGQDEMAARAIADLLRYMPHFRTEHVAGYLAMRDEALVGHVANTLRQAGLTDDANLALPDRPSIAILPFANLSSDPEQEFLADGIADDVITGLAKFKSLFVIARSSSFSFKGQSADVRHIARELGVRYVLEGTLRSAGDRIRVTGQLVDAETGKHIWADRYDDRLEDLFAVQDQITNAIVRAIEPKISKAERDRARRNPPGSIDAWALYQRGLTSYFATTEDGLLEALTQFDQLCELDPNFGPGFAMAADTRSRLVTHYQSDRANELLSIAENKAARALELEPQDPVSYWSDGRVKCMQHRYDQAIPQLEQAVALNPNYAMAYHSLGFTLTHAGRPEEAIAQQERAIRISPFDAFVGGFLAVKCHALLLLERFEETFATAQQALRSPNPRYWVYASMAIACAELGRHQEAQQAVQELLRQKPNFGQHVAALNHPGMNIVFVELFAKHNLLNGSGTANFSEE